MLRNAQEADQLAPAAPSAAAVYPSHRKDRITQCSTYGSGVRLRRLHIAGYSMSLSTDFFPIRLDQANIETFAQATKALASTILLHQPLCPSDKCPSDESVDVISALTWFRTCNYTSTAEHTIIQTEHKLCNSYNVPSWASGALNRLCGAPHCWRWQS